MAKKRPKSIKKPKTCVVGVDLGATSIKAARVDLGGAIEARRSVATEPAEGPEAVLGRVTGLVNELGAVDPQIGGRGPVHLHDPRLDLDLPWRDVQGLG